MRGDLSQDDEQPDLGHGAEPRGGVSGRTLLIAAVIMVAVGYGLAVKLREMGRIQDCVMSGRTNCAPVSGDEK
jgi:hypothetical protein